MARIITLWALLLLCLVAARADILRLRNGATIEGKFVSGTEKGIWFERAPEGSALYPLSLVEGVTFGAYVPFSARQNRPKNEMGDETGKATQPRIREWPQAGKSAVRLPANSFR